MKSKFLALAFFIMGFSFTNIYAKDKEKESAIHIPYYTASANHIFVLQGPSMQFSPLNFLHHRHKNTNSIKLTKEGTVFKLEPGSYQITFTGTFEAVPGQGISQIDLGFQVNDKVVAVNQKSIESNYDNYQIVTISQIFKFDEKKKVSIVARNTEAGQTTDVLQRSISILKID